jgi:L-ascorbate metabolism protein UlaG (beta-lactamase superfamily)
MAKPKNAPRPAAGACRRPFLAGAFFSLFLSSFLAACASSPDYPVSSHYDGSHFFNPEGPPGNTFWEVVKMLFSRDYQKWPEKIENLPASPASLDLSENEVAITFVNHATALIQLKGYNILTDPVWSERVGPLSWVGPKRKRLPGLSFDELPKIDLVLVSHNHYDHLDLPTLKMLDDRFSPKIIVPLGNKALLKMSEIRNVEEMDWWGSLPFDSSLTVDMVPAHHRSGRGLFDQNKTLWAGYVLSFRGRRIFFAGDTAYSPHFKAIKAKLGAADISLLPIGAYEPRWFMRAVHTNPEEAAQAHLDLGSKQSIAIHFGTFQLTNEAMEQPLLDLAQARQKLSIPPESFKALPEGQTKIFELERAPASPAAPARAGP